MARAAVTRRPTGLQHWGGRNGKGRAFQFGAYTEYSAGSLLAGRKSEKPGPAHTCTGRQLPVRRRCGALISHKVGARAPLASSSRSAFTELRAAGAGPAAEHVEDAEKCEACRASSAHCCRDWRRRLCMLVGGLGGDGREGDLLWAHKCLLLSHKVWRLIRSCSGLQRTFTEYRSTVRTKPTSKVQER